ncbi:RHS repeat-associated core domain-containing protein [Pseudomonas syringae]|uniref:RHS repeat-associated core domain-containing protein n=1 Tax=Pseudomonas syringae TaxID=317 RepID=UPI00234224EC|nr:RHS repeat-associated core domain-containing protein [Pseudomonas syringae]
MTSPDQTVLCTYRYDPLDRLASSSPVGLADIRRFYQKNRLATEIQGALQRTVFQHEDLLLAQQRQVDGVVDTTLLATDQQRSVLRLVDRSGIEPVAYSVYGHHPAESGLTSLLGFNGERRDPVTGHYLLGNGYRAYNPVLMRFNSPDSLSPFDEGGLNAYGYCGGDPVGFVDETGHAKLRVITDMAARVLNRARPSVIVRAPPIMKKGSSRLIASVPSSVEVNYAYSYTANHTAGTISGVGQSSSSATRRSSVGAQISASPSAGSSVVKDRLGTDFWLRDDTYMLGVGNTPEGKRIRAVARRGLFKHISTDVPGQQGLAQLKYKYIEARVKKAHVLKEYFSKSPASLPPSNTPTSQSLAAHTLKYEQALASYKRYDAEYTATHGAYIRDAGQLK